MSARRRRLAAAMTNGAQTGNVPDRRDLPAVRMNMRHENGAYVSRQRMRPRPYLGRAAVPRDQSCLISEPPRLCEHEAQGREGVLRRDENTLVGAIQRHSGHRRQQFRQAGRQVRLRAVFDRCAAEEVRRVHRGNRRCRAATPPTHPRRCGARARCSPIPGPTAPPGSDNPWSG